MTYISVAVLAAIFSLVWFATSPGWEPLVTLASAIGVLAGIHHSDTKNSDRTLFKEFLSSLPSEGGISTAKEYDFGGPFQLEWLKDLRIHLYTWNHPEYEFRDTKIEKRRQDLLTDIDVFLGAIGKHTSPNGIGVQEIPRHWMYERPHDFRRAQEEINEAGRKLSETHADLIRLARRRLKI